MVQTFGERLRVLRKRRGMTQADLAQAMGCTVQTIVRYESLLLEEVRPARLKAFAEALDVDERELTGAWDEDESEEEISLLTRGLKRMDPAQRSSLIRMMMPLVMQFQREQEAEGDGPDAPA